LGVAAYGVLATEVRLARRLIGQPFGNAGPGGEGIYGAGPGSPLVLGFLGDSSAVGLGVDHPWQTPGAVVATGLAAIAGRRVQLRVTAVVGAESSALDDQATRLLADHPEPDVVVIMVGANDVTHRQRPSVAVRGLDAAVRRLREAGCEVIVGTCPDLGTIEPIPWPLRYIVRRGSRELAAAQTIAVVEAGGRTVSLGDLLGPEFEARPSEMFSSDRFHPSAAGYARAAAALLPSVATALGYWAAERDRGPDVRRGEGIDDIAHAAVRAVDTAGTEVAGIEVSGAERGPRGRWAVLLRRRTTVPATASADQPPAVAQPPADQPTPADQSFGMDAAASNGAGAVNAATSAATVATTTPD
jgi:lysophospholipase L1-like esterase